MGWHAAVSAAQAKRLLGIHRGPVQQLGHRAAGGCELNDQVTQAGVAQVDAQLDVLYRDGAVDAEGFAVSALAIRNGHFQTKCSG